MKTVFPKKEFHQPQWFLLDASEQTLGRLATEASKLLRGKETTFYTPGVDQGNYVVIINAEKISVTGNKEKGKLYYRNNRRPGSLKIESFQSLKRRLPSRILEKAIWGMLPKGRLGRIQYKRLFVYKGEQPVMKKNISEQTVALQYWKKIELNKSK